MAADRLLTSRDAIAVIAPSLGDESDDAFSTAFKRMMGCARRDDVPSAPSWSIALAAGTLAMVGRDQNIALLFPGKPT